MSKETKKLTIEFSDKSFEAMEKLFKECVEDEDLDFKVKSEEEGVEDRKPTLEEFIHDLACDGLIVMQKQLVRSKISKVATEALKDLSEALSDQVEKLGLSEDKEEAEEK